MELHTVQFSSLTTTLEEYHIIIDMGKCGCTGSMVVYQLCLRNQVYNYIHRERKRDTDMIVLYEETAGGSDRKKIDAHIYIRQ